MIILEKPYVSDYLIQTIKKNNFRVFDNEISRKYFPAEKLYSKLDENELIYSNSENSISKVVEQLPNSKISEMIELSKNKVKFREAIKNIYPDYYFKEITIDEIKSINPSLIPFPVVLKPSVGFLSFGVYPVKDKNEWSGVIKNIQRDIEGFKDIFPKSVVNTASFIIEEMIDGEEYAIDAYFNDNKESVILNIYHHPFFDDKDVSDRVYYTSSDIIKKYLEKFKTLLDKIGQNAGYKNFPFHLELRVKEDKIIPIELNPMRFCGWCITDIAQNAWGINVYEYFFNKKIPDWNQILKNSDNGMYYFTIADIPQKINRETIKNINYNSYLKNISNPLEIRKIDYKKNPIFAIVFAKTDKTDEIKNLLKLDMSEFIEIV